MDYYCNPVNVPYRYQFNKAVYNDTIEVSREGADPSIIQFKGKYYIFASMSLSVWVSEDLVKWESHRLPDYLPLYDYAPDARVIGEYVYFCASKYETPCNFYRTKDILNGPYEEIKGSFAFWDPNIFQDEDGRIYFYWGCDSLTPIWGVELDPETMQPLTAPQELIFGNPWDNGYERIGDDNSISPLRDEEIDAEMERMAEERGVSLAQIPAERCERARAYASRRPYIEGAWMTRHNGRYYLQYACTGAEYNVYADGVYVSDNPLGPFRLARNNPYSLKPGGYLPGAGHGSTMEDLQGALWHTATMRIHMNHQFERRIGLWPAGFDEDGELFCNQRYGDWPLSVEAARKNPWCDPEWFLLSCRKQAACSSSQEGKGPEKALDENVQTWWRAAKSAPGEWISVDLGKIYEVHAVQINFADDKIDIPLPGKLHTDLDMPRYIEEAQMVTRWKLEGSADGENWHMLMDRSDTDTCLPHDLYVTETGMQLRFVKLTVLEIPYGQPPCISGLRVFGLGDGKKPEVPEFRVMRQTDLDMAVIIQASDASPDAVGYNILWGNSPEKLYHSYMIFGKTEQHIGSLVRGQSYYVRVDAFNESGITEGTVLKV